MKQVLSRTGSCDTFRPRHAESSVKPNVLRDYIFYAFCCFSSLVLYLASFIQEGSIYKTSNLLNQSTLYFTRTTGSFRAQELQYWPDLNMKVQRYAYCVCGKSLKSRNCSATDVSLFSHIYRFIYDMFCM